MTDLQLAAEHVLLLWNTERLRPLDGHYSRVNETMTALRKALMKEQADAVNQEQQK